MVKERLTLSYYLIIFKVKVVKERLTLSFDNNQGKGGVSFQDMPLTIFL